MLNFSSATPSCPAAATPPPTPPCVTTLANVFYRTIYHEGDPAFMSDTASPEGGPRDSSGWNPPPPSALAPAGTSQDLYYRGAGRKPRVAVIATHYQIDFSEHYIADYLATQGRRLPRLEHPFPRLRERFLLDHALVDIGSGRR